MCRIRSLHTGDVKSRCLVHRLVIYVSKLRMVHRRTQGIRLVRASRWITTLRPIWSYSCYRCQTITGGLHRGEREAVPQVSGRAKTRCLSGFELAECKRAQVCTMVCGLCSWCWSSLKRSSPPPFIARRRRGRYYSGVRCWRDRVVTRVFRSCCVMAPRPFVPSSDL